MGFIRNALVGAVAGSVRTFVEIKAEVQAVIKSSWSNTFETGQIFNTGTSVKNPYAEVGNVYKPVKAIVDNFPQAEFVFKRESDKERIEEPDLKKLFDKPNPLMSFNDFQQAIAGYQALCGEFFIVMEYADPSYIGNGKILPIELWPFNPKKMQVVKDASPEHRGKEIIKGWKYGNSFFEPEQVIHSKDFNPTDILRGLSPLTVIKNEIEISWETLIFNKAFFQNSASPNLALSTDKTMVETDRNRLITWINQNFKGSSKSFKTILLDKGLKADMLASNHKEMDYVKQKAYNREEMIGIWRVPKMLFSITDSLNYALSKDQMKIFWEVTLLPMLKKEKVAINNELIKPYNPTIYLDYDLSNIPAFAEDLEKKIAIVERLVKINVPLNDALKKAELGFEEYKWGAEPLVSFSMVPISTVFVGDTTKTTNNNDDTKALENKTVPVVVKADPRWIKFNILHNKIERAMGSALSNYFFKQRVRALASLEKAKHDFINKKDFSYSIDWEEENKRLVAAMRPYFVVMAKAGFDFAESFEIQAQSLELLNQQMATSIAGNTERIKFINETTRDQLASKINDAIQNGIAEGLTNEQIAEKVNEAMKGVYNNTKARSRMIARTEVTSGMNASSHSYYVNAGVKQEQWISAGDEFVRGNDPKDMANHVIMNGETVATGSTFSNGLRFPGDPAGSNPAEVINCRCTLAPVV